MTAALPAAHTHQAAVSLTHSSAAASLCCTHPPNTQALLKQEVLNIDAVEDLLGKRPFTNATLQNIDRYRWVHASRLAGVGWVAGLC